jgi:hypothetical protein
MIDTREKILREGEIIVASKEFSIDMSKVKDKKDFDKKVKKEMRLFKKETKQL